MNNYTCKLRSVGNPDHAQYAPVSNPKFVESDTLTGIASAAREYISFWNLGGGNWPKTIVKQHGKPVAIISYNGRLWDFRDRSKEIPCAS